MNSYAPVLITVYNRPRHFKSCIESLEKNHGAKETSLFIAIDSPSREVDVKPNNDIVTIASNITGFKHVEIIKREKNLGARENIVQARTSIFSKYDSIIMSEDDNIFSPFFLNFINEGLRIYQDDEKVFAICGYNYDIGIPQGYDKDFYFAKAFSAWGYGTWRDKFQAVDWETKNFWSDFVNPLEVIRFNQQVGDHVFMHMLSSKMKKQIYGDTSICFHLYKRNIFCISPTISLVRNLGHDGSGLHCVRQKEEGFHSQMIWGEARYPKVDLLDISEKPQYRKLLNAYLHKTICKKIASYLLYLFHFLLRFRFR